MHNDRPHTEEFFMRRALELARLGMGYVSPNPLVGCVIVHDNKIIGEGWHKKYGEAHAEVNAVQSMEDKSLLPECVVYVSLEPCSHTGKTPPCADMLITHNVKKVVIANSDPNPLVAGGGIKKLRAAGIEVVTDVLAAEGRYLNRRFFTSMQRHRPYVILKWAQTADGFIARENYDSKWISNEYSRRLVHKWRAEEDAVLVGTNTAHYDDPQLNVRDWTGRNPVRVVIDRSLKLEATCKLFDGTQETICYNLKKDEVHETLTFVRLSEPFTVEDVLQDLHRRRIQSILVEGGTQLLNSFINGNLWDEARVFLSACTFTQGIQAPDVAGNLISQESVMNDRLQIYTSHDKSSH